MYLLLVSALLLPMQLAAESQAFNHIVAIVNDDVITKYELNTQVNLIQQQLQERGTSLPPAHILEKQVLERMVLSRLQLQLAKRSGIRIDDESLNQGLRTLAKQNGLTLEQFRDALERDGYPYASFREQIRNEMITRRLHQKTVESRVQVTDQEIENELANQASQDAQQNEYQLGHILIPIPEAASADAIRTAQGRAQSVLDQLRNGADFSKQAVAVSAGQKALEGGNLGWRKAAQLPTLFVEVVETMALGDISNLIRSPSGFHIIKLLDKRGETRKLVRQANIRHIELRTDELHGETEIRSRLRQLKTRIENGEDFATLAKSHSQDAETAANGGNLGWITPGTLDRGFSKGIANLQKGEISEPFQTRSGFHIVQVQDWRNYDSTDEFQRSRARQIIAERKSEEELGIWLRRLRDEAYVELRLDE